MNHTHKLWFSEDEASELDQAEANRQTASLGGLMIALLLVVIGLFLVRELHAKALVEDCMLSGSISCQAVIVR